MRPGIYIGLMGSMLLAFSGAAISLQDQIDRAHPGSVIEVPPGEYAGPLLISKPLTLRGRDLPRLIGNGQTHVILIQAPDVTIDGFQITGSGTDLSKDHAGIFVRGDRALIQNNMIRDSLHGIYLKKINGCRIINNVIEGKKERTVPAKDAPPGLVPDGAEFCTLALDPNQRGNGIHLWNSTDNLIAENEITEARDGIYFSFSHRTEVRKNRIHRVRYGLHYMYSDQNVFKHNRFTRNAAGAAIMYSENLWVYQNQFTGNRGHRAYGLLLQSVDQSQIIENRLSANTVGIYLENSNQILLRGNEVDRNYVGVRLGSSSADNQFTENFFGANLHPIETTGQGGNNHWAVDGVGNFWESAKVIDFNGDGIGEVSHRELDLLGPYRRHFPAATLLSGSPAARLLQWSHRHAAWPGLNGIKDPAPLNRPKGKAGKASDLSLSTLSNP